MDNFLDKIKKGAEVAMTEAKKLTKVVKDKTTDIVDVTKLNFSLNEIEGKIEKLYIKIGESVYKSSCGEDTDLDIDALCAEISDLFENANDIKEQIAEVKNTVTCPTCNEQASKAAGFCSNCGTKLGAKEETDDMVIEVADLED